LAQFCFDQIATITPRTHAGGCADEPDTSVPGVLAVLSQADFEVLEAQEMAERNPVPPRVSRPQGKAALIQVGL
jgi:hypothetical protein